MEPKQGRKLRRPLYSPEERILYFAMQPDNARQTAKDLALTALAQDGALAGLGGWHGSIGAHRTISGSSLRESR